MGERMFYYKIYGMTVESDIELQEAYGYVTDGTPQIIIYYSDMGEILKEIESVIADKPIKAVSVLVKHQHMNNGYGKDKIKRFFQSGG